MELQLTVNELAKLKYAISCAISDLSSDIEFWQNKLDSGVSDHPEDILRWNRFIETSKEDIVTLNRIRNMTDLEILGSHHDC